MGFPRANSTSKSGSKKFLKGWEEGLEELLGIIVNHMPNTWLYKDITSVER